MTITTNIVKTTLWASVLFNLGAGYSFAFPGSFSGQLIGLPQTINSVYAAMTGYMICLFAGAYAWLALKSEPEKPLLFFLAAGKFGVFMVAVGLWLSGIISMLLILVAFGDLVFSLIWFWWLYANRKYSTA